MSWLDPQRRQEPAAETALREELRLLMGLKPRNFFESEPTPELVALAEDLRREAKRRNHTARSRSHWMLMAAALPLALAFGGVSLWGIHQKHRAEDLAQAMALKDDALARMANTRHQEEHAAVQAKNPQPLLTAGHRTAKPGPKGKELVIPVEHPASQLPQDLQQVKGH